MVRMEDNWGMLVEKTSRLDVLPQQMKAFLGRNSKSLSSWFPTCLASLESCFQREAGWGHMLEPEESLQGRQLGREGRCCQR